ncbi:leucine-rich repeat transmembrane protein CCDC168-like [Erinaceus europaeus]|uniref:Leucine-rich repeat transmembrane protein CCDC168-like n=1 Tax=Erinaceus europaeus TaxID=9365 RepID=A0ABM3XGB3_ERIEU|nr:leucine-rich repeat transmembrane protein CCDC168-like [Erinaceus europaeus]
MTFDDQSSSSFLEESFYYRNGNFSERTITSSFTSEENEGSFESRVSSEEVTWTSTSKSKYKVRHLSKNHMSSSSGTSSSLSLFHEDVKEVFLSHSSGCPESEQETIHFSSKKLFSIMKTNKNKMLTFSSDFNFSKKSQITVENEYLDVAPCPPAHLFLSREQIRLLEENLRNQIPLKSKGRGEGETPYMNSIYQEVLIQNQPSMNPKQGSFQGFCEAKSTSQAPQCLHNQESVSNHADTKTSRPHDVMKPFSRSMQESFRAQNLSRSPHLVKIPCSVDTQDSAEDLQADRECLDEHPCSVWIEVPEEIEYVIQGQNTTSKNARSLSPDSGAKGVPQLKNMKRDGQQENISSESSQCSACDSVPLLTAMKRQENRRETLYSKNKLNPRVPSRKSEKTPPSQVFQTTPVGQTSRHSSLGYRCNSEKKEDSHQRECISLKVLNCIHVSKHNRENKELKCISPRSSPQLEQSFMVNIHQAPCSSPIERNWRNQESFKSPVIQAKGIGAAGVCAPSRKEMSELPTPAHSIPSGEVIAESRQQFIFSSEPKSNRRMDIPSVHNFHLTLSNGKKLPASPPEMQKSSPQGNAQSQEDFLKIVLESSDVNLLISLGNTKQEGHEQSGDVQAQKSTEDIILKGEDPLVINITECGRQRENGELERDTKSNLQILQGERIPGISPSATDPTASEPCDMAMHNRLKTQTDTSRKVGHSPSAAKQEELPEGKKTGVTDCTEKRRLFDKPQEHGREEEERASPEAVPQLTQKFRYSLELKQKSTYVKLEIEQNISGKEKTQDEEQEVQSQTLSPQTTEGTVLCPTAVPFQGGEAKQNTDRLMGGETADPENPLKVREKLPIGGGVSIETADCKISLGGDLGTIPGDSIAEEKNIVKGVGPAVSLESSVISMLPSSDLERKRNRRDLPGTKSVPSTTRKIKQPVTSTIRSNNRHAIGRHGNRLIGNSKVIVKQILEDKTMTDVLLNVTDPHSSSLPSTRTCSGYHAGNHSYTKLMQERPQAEKAERCSDVMQKGSDSGSTLETRLQGELRQHKETPVRMVFQGSWDHGADTYSKKAWKTEKEIYQLTLPTQMTVESTYFPRMSSSQDEQMRTSLTTQVDSKHTPGPQRASPTTEMSLTEDRLSQAGENDAPDCVRDVREIAYCFAETKGEFSEHIPDTMPETLHSYMSVLASPKMKKNRVRFSLTDCAVQSVHVSKTSSDSQTSSPTGHGKQGESSLNTNQIDRLAYEFLNTLFCPRSIRVQGDTDSSSHAQLRQGELGDGRRPQYMDFITKGSAFYCREEKVQYGEEEEQSTQLHTAPEQAHCLHLDGSQRMEPHFIEPDPALACLTQELPVKRQDVRYQTCFAQAALQTDFQVSPREVEATTQKANETEKQLVGPVEPKMPPFKPETALMDKLLSSPTDHGLPSVGEHERERDPYVMGNDSVLSKDLQVSFLQSSDFTEHFISKYERKRRLLSSSQKHMDGLNMRDKSRRKHRMGLRSSFATKSKTVDLGKHVSDQIHFFMTSASDCTYVYRRVGREKDKSGEERLSSTHVKEMTSPHEGSIISDNSRETGSQDEGVSEQAMALEGILQHSQHFIFCSGRRKECDLQKSENQGRGIILSVMEQGHPRQMQPKGLMHAQELKTNHQLQNDKICSLSSQISLLRSEESLMGLILTDRKKSSPLCDGILTRKQNSCDKEEKTELTEYLPATDLESPAISKPDLAESQRRRKTVTHRAFKTTMLHKDMKTKARKTPISQVFNILGNGCSKYLPPKAMKLQIFDFLVQIKYFEFLDDLTTQVKRDLAQELPAAVLESLDSSLFPLPVSERKKYLLKFTKRAKRSPLHITTQEKKTAVSQTFNTIKHSLSSSRRQFERNFKTMVRQGQTVADIILNVISSSVPVSPDIKMHSHVKVETDMRWERDLSHEREKPDREKVSVDSKAQKVKTPHLVKSDLESLNTARKKSPHPLATPWEQLQHTLLTQRLVHSVSCSILNSLTLENQQKRTKTLKGLKGTGTSSIFPLVPRKSVSASLIITTQSDCSPERDLRRELACPLPRGKIWVQKKPHMRTLKSLGFWKPESSKCKGQRKVTQISHSRIGKTQISVLKTIRLTRPGILSRRKEQDYVLEYIAREIAQGLSDKYVDDGLSLTPVSFASQTRIKVKAKRGPLKKRSNVTQLQYENKSPYNYSSARHSTSDNTSESVSQTEREGNGLSCRVDLQFLRKTGSRKDQNRSAVEQKVQGHTVVSEEAVDSVYSPLMIPFQNEEPVFHAPQKDTLQRTGGKIPCPELVNTVLDDLLIDDMQYSGPTCDRNPKRKLGVSSVLSQQFEVDEDINSQKILKSLNNHNIISTMPKSSVFADPCEESPSKKESNHVAKKHKEWQRDLMMFRMSVLSASRRQKRALTFPERRALKSSRHKARRTKKSLYSQKPNIPEPGDLSYRNKEDCNLKSVIKHMKQNKSIANAFSFPILVATCKKTGREMHCIPKIEMDKARTKTDHTKLEKSPCDREAWEASLTNMQNRWSNARKMNVQHEKEKNTIHELLDSASLYHHQFTFGARPNKDLGASKSEPKPNISEGRQTWNSPCMMQGNHIHKMILKSAARQVMSFLQAEAVKTSSRIQEKKKPMNVDRSESGSRQHESPQEGNVRRRWDNHIFDEKSRNQNTQGNTILQTLDLPNLDLSECQNQGNTFKSVSQRSTTSSKHTTLKAEKLPVSQLLHITRCLRRRHRKKEQSKLKYKTKGWPWNESVREAFFCAFEAAKIPTPGLVVDELLLHTTVRDTQDDRILHKNRDGHIPEETAELGENLATSFSEPWDFFVPIVPDSESQIKTVSLSDKNIRLSSRYLIRKRREPVVSQILKIDRPLTKSKKMHGPNLKIKIKETRQCHDLSERISDTICFMSDTSEATRQSRSQTQRERPPRLSCVQSAQMDLPAEELVIAQPLNVTDPAALCLNKEQGQEADMKSSRTVSDAASKFTHVSIPTLLNIKMEQAPSSWHIYEESSIKRNAPRKAKVRKLFKTTPHTTQPLASGADQRRGSGLFTSEAPLVNMVLPVCSSQKTEVDSPAQEAKTHSVEGFRLEDFPFSKTPLLQVAKQKKEFKDANLETIANPTILMSKAEKPRMEVHLSTTRQGGDSQQPRGGKEPEKQGMSPEVWSLLTDKESNRRDTPVVQPPWAEGVDLLIPRKGDQQERYTYELLQKPASSHKVGPHQVNPSEQQIKSEGTNMMQFEHSTPQAKEALKGMDIIMIPRSRNT